MALWRGRLVGQMEEDVSGTLDRRWFLIEEIFFFIRIVKTFFYRRPPKTLYRGSFILYCLSRLYLVRGDVLQGGHGGGSVQVVVPSQGKRCHRIRSYTRSGLAPKKPNQKKSRNSNMKKPTWNGFFGVFLFFLRFFIVNHLVKLTKFDLEYFNALEKKS